MTEAVIVSTARSPFGRAFKGSLKEVRPDDLAATVIQAALDKVPGLDKTLVEDLYLGCAEPSGKHGSNMAKVVATLLGLDATPAATINRFCASSAQTTRMAFHAIKAGEGDIFVSAGAECVSQYTDWAGAGGAKADAQNPRFAEAHEGHRAAVEVLRARLAAVPVSSGARPVIPTLTKREEATARALYASTTHAELAAALSVSVNTVKVHLRNLYAKLGVTSKREAVDLLQSAGFFELP